MIHAMPTLAAGHQAADWELPKNLLTLWTAYERLTDADVPDNGELPATRQATVKALLDAAMTGEPLPGEDTPSDGRKSLDFDHAWTAARRDALEQLTEQISRHDRAPVYEALQNALDEAMERFRGDIAAAGAWATIDPSRIPLALLDEPREVIDAVKRVLGDTPRRYMAIRTAWSFLRGPGVTAGQYGYNAGEDPNLPTAEVDNWHDIAPDWTPANRRDWKAGMVHQWLGDLINRGARMWVPSAHQQLMQHLEDFPPAPPRRAGQGVVDPFTFAGRPAA